MSSHCPILGTPVDLFVPLSLKATHLGKPYRPKEASGGGSTIGSHSLQDGLTCQRKVGFRLLQVEPVLADYVTLGSLVHERAAYYYASMAMYPPKWYRPESARGDMLKALRDISDDAELIGQSEVIWSHALDWLNSDYGYFSGRPLLVECEIAATLWEIGAVAPGHPYANEVVTSRLDFLRGDSSKVFADDYKVRGVRGTKGKKQLNTFNPASHQTDFQAALTETILRARLQPGLTFGGFTHNRIGREYPYPCERNLIRVHRDMMVRVPELALQGVAVHHDIHTEVSSLLRGKDLSTMSETERLDKVFHLLPNGALTGACHKGGAQFPCFYTNICWG